MHKDKRALAATLRKYQRHILGPLFVEAADAIEELLDTVEAQKAEIITMAADADKQTAKKPMNRSGWPEEGRDTANGYCPSCGIELVCITPRYYCEHDFYCRNCGQKIDWKPEQEENEPCEACKIGGNADGAG